MTILLVVHGAHALEEARADLEEVGWPVVQGWAVAAGEVGTGTTRSYDDLGVIVLAALTGAGVVVDVGDERALAERLCDDLRRIGAVEHRSAATGWAVLTEEQRRLLDLLADGVPLGIAGRRLNLSRRSADRRLAAARALLGAASTGAAVHARRARLASLPRP